MATQCLHKQAQAPFRRNLRGRSCSSWRPGRRPSLRVVANREQRVERAPSASRPRRVHWCVRRYAHLRVPTPPTPVTLSWAGTRGLTSLPARRPGQERRRRNGGEAARAGGSLGTAWRVSALSPAKEAADSLSAVAFSATCHSAPRSGCGGGDATNCLCVPERGTAREREGVRGARQRASKLFPLTTSNSSREAAAPSCPSPSLPPPDPSLPPRLLRLLLLLPLPLIL